MIKKWRIITKQTIQRLARSVLMTIAARYRGDEMVFIVAVAPQKMWQSVETSDFFMRSVSSEAALRVVDKDEKLEN